MSAAFMLLEYLATRRAIVCLCAAALVACVAWAAAAWSDARRELDRRMELQADAAVLPLVIAIDDAAAGLAQPDAAADISAAPDLPAFDRALTEAQARAADDRPGLSLPFELDGAWRAVMAAPATGEPARYRLIDLDRVVKYWGGSAARLTVLSRAGGVWRPWPIAAGAAARADAEAGDGVAVERRIDRYGVALRVGYPTGAVATAWLAHFPLSLGFVAVMALLTLPLAVRAGARARANAAALDRAKQDEARLYDWAKHSADLFWETDRTHRFVEFRNVGRTVTPEMLDFCVGRTRWELAGVDDPDASPFWRAHLADIRAERPIQNLEYAVIGPRGRREIRVSGAPFYDAEGRFAGYRGVTVDIDAEKTAQRALIKSQEAVAASERLFRSVIEQFPGTVSIKDTESRLLLHNRRFAETFGLEGGEGLGKTMSEAATNIVGAAVEARDQSVLRGKQTLELERAVDDAVLKIVKYPLLDERGDCTALVSVGYDITERRGAEEKLAESERRLAQMVELLPAGAVYLEDNQITINSAMETITGRSRDELATLDDWFRLAPVRGEAAARANYERQRRDGFQRAVRFAIRRPDGGTREIEWAAYRAGPREVWLVKDITDIVEADARFRTLFENSATGHVIAQDGKIADCNAAAARLLGWETADEVVGRTLLDMAPPRQPDGALSHERLQELRDKLRDSGAASYEFSMLRTDGTEVELEVTATQIAYRDRPAVLKEWRDNSERKAHEQELVRSREQVELERRLAIERMNDSTRAISGWIWETDADDRFMFMTDSVERVTGLSPEWHYGKTRRELRGAWSSDDGPDPLDVIDAAVAARAPFRDVDFFRRDPDGTERWMRTSGTPRYDDDGGFQGYRGAAFSIDYEKQLEAAQETLGKEAARARRRLEDAIEAQHSGFALFDAEDRLVACNAAFKEVVPLSADKIEIGATFAEMLDLAADELGLEGEARKVFIDKRMHVHLNDVGTLMRKMSNGRWIKSEERPTAEGGIVGAWTDVTELIMAREAAEAANVAKSEFLAMISHEIRTPMNAVLGMASVLLQGEMAADQRAQVETIQRSGATLLSLINDVLDLSKIEAGKIELEEEEFSLFELIDSVLEIAGEQALAKGLRLSAFAEAATPDRLVGDPNRLRQILMNLVSNAVKFTESGDVRVDAAVTRRRADGACVLRIDVVDTGIGIPTSTLDRLFQPFSQADASTTRRYGGTGLGLTICKQLAELLGGAIGVESTPGAGSRFWIEAPFRPGDAPAASEAIAFDGEECLVVAPEGLEREALIDVVTDLGGAPVVVDGVAAAGRMRLDSEDRRYAVMLVSTADGAEPAFELARAAGPAVEQVVVVGDDAAAATDALHDATVRRAGARSWRLFAHPETEALPAPEATVAAPPEPHGAEAKGRRILLVEDNRVNQMVAKAMLQLDGHVVEVAEDGVAAISAVLRKPYDLIFMDMQMPQMDGLDATREIRALAGPAATTPIVAMTANAMDDDRKRCFEAGMDDFLSKPIDHRLLTETIERWTAASGAGATDGAPDAPGQGPSESPDQMTLLRLVDDLDAYLDDRDDLTGAGAA